MGGTEPGSEGETRFTNAVGGHAMIVEEGKSNVMGKCPVSLAVWHIKVNSISTPLFFLKFLGPRSDFTQNAPTLSKESPNTRDLYMCRN